MRVLLVVLISGLLTSNLAVASADSSSAPVSLTDAKQAFTAGDYARSIELFRELLASKEGETAIRALEYLGVAYQHSGQYAEAEAVYQRFLSEYRGHSTAGRVQQRLDALSIAQLDRNQSVANAAPRERPVAGPWRWSADVSQEFWRFEEARDGLGTTSSASSLLSWLDLEVDREGERFNLGATVNAGYLHELERTVEVGGNDASGLISNAYLSIDDVAWDVSARVGRQTLYADGVFGRFDGVRVSKRWRDDYRFNVTLGLPVDAPGYVADTDRQFIAASTDIALLADRLDLNLYGLLGTIDGLSNRQAVGGQAAWRRERWSVQGAVDYDVSYAVLNSALLQGNWRPFARLSGYVRAHWFASPFLVTRNALIGQPVATLDGLRDTYTEGQLRFLARQRTRDATLLATGATYRLSERWLAKADVSYYDADDTPDAGGVPGTPNETHIVSGFSLTGTSVVRAQDTAIVSAQLSSNTRYDLWSGWLDYRVPLGSKLRLVPRVALSLREGGASVDDAWIATPSLRLLYRPRPRYRFEVEVGGRWMQQELASDPFLASLLNDDTELSTEFYVNLSWRMTL